MTSSVHPAQFDIDKCVLHIIMFLFRNLTILPFFSVRLAKEFDHKQLHTYEGTYPNIYQI